MASLDDAPVLQQIYDFALPAMMRTMVACGRLDSSQDAELRTEMRPCSLKLLRLFVELKMQVGGCLSVYLSICLDAH